MSIFNVRAVTPRNRQHLLVRVAACALLAVTALGLGACEAEDEAAPAATTNRQVSGVDPKSLQPVAGETIYDVNEINGQIPPKNAPVVVNSQSTQRVTIRGWAVDKHAQNNSGGVFINVDGKTDIETSSQDRPDVAEAYKNPNYRQAGFQAAIPTATLGKGRHTLSLKILTADRKGYYEPKQKFEVEVQ